MNPNNRSSAEQVMGALGLAFVALAVVVVLGWTRWHTQIARAVMLSQHWEMQAIGLVSNRYRDLDAQVMASAPSTVRPMALVKLCADVGRFFRIPVCIVLLALAARCLFRASSGRFTRQFSIETLAELQAIDFPVIKAFLGRDLKLVLPAEGAVRPLDPPLHRDEWVARYATSPSGRFDEAAAFATLQTQLGVSWRGVEQAAPHVQCLALGFWLHAQVRREDAIDVLSSLSTALKGRGARGPAGPEKAVDLPQSFGPEMRRLLKSTHASKEIDALVSGHAYTAPALMTLLMHARRKAGVLNPGAFAAVKLVDRALWFALHCLGFPQETGPIWHVMPAPCVEASAALEHWQTECEAGRALLDAAVTSSLDRVRILARHAAPT